MRSDGRSANQLRATPGNGRLPCNSRRLRADRGRQHSGSCLATIEDSVPGFLRGTGKGWVTAEYSMLPRSTVTRTPREITKGRASGRTHGIQRLIGRSLR